ncbi:hypothetical protein AcV7_010013 [Taiwanofungus camphoratus]|nr:hypothetical protein AcV7_010013 [Antrodia cinnamomea]
MELLTVTFWLRKEVMVLMDCADGSSEDSFLCIELFRGLPYNTAGPGGHYQVKILKMISRFDPHIVTTVRRFLHTPP